MILKKEDFSFLGTDGAQASAGSIYKLLLFYNYEIEKDIDKQDIRYLVQNNVKVAEVNINDIIYYLYDKHATYKLYVTRLDKALKSKFERNRALAPEYENVLRQLEELYTAKYLFKQIPLTLRVEYLK